MVGFCFFSYFSLSLSLFVLCHCRSYTLLGIDCEEYSVWLRWCGGLSWLGGNVFIQLFPAVYHYRHHFKMIIFAAMMCLKHVLACFGRPRFNQNDTGLASASTYQNNNHLEKKFTKSLLKLPYIVFLCFSSPQIVYTAPLSCST